MSFSNLKMVVWKSFVWFIGLWREEWHLCHWHSMPSWHAWPKLYSPLPGQPGALYQWQRFCSLLYSSMNFDFDYFKGRKATFVCFKLCCGSNCHWWLLSEMHEDSFLTPLPTYKMLALLPQLPHLLRLFLYFLSLVCLSIDTEMSMLGGKKKIKNQSTVSVVMSIWGWCSWGISTICR